MASAGTRKYQRRVPGLGLSVPGLEVSVLREGVLREHRHVSPRALPAPSSAAPGGQNGGVEQLSVARRAGGRAQPGAARDTKSPTLSGPGALTTALFLRRPSLRSQVPNAQSCVCPGPNRRYVPWHWSKAGPGHVAQPAECSRPVFVELLTASRLALSCALLRLSRYFKRLTQKGKETLHKTHGGDCTPPPWILSGVTDEPELHRFWRLLSSGLDFLRTGLLNLIQRKLQKSTFT
ncbi:hypothetical protein NN561_005561 [Cricetulus griseus]